MSINSSRSLILSAVTDNRGAPAKRQKRGDENGDESVDGDDNGDGDGDSDEASVDKEYDIVMEKKRTDELCSLCSSLCVAAPLHSFWTFILESWSSVLDLLDILRKLRRALQTWLWTVQEHGIAHLEPQTSSVALLRED